MREAEGRNVGKSALGEKYTIMAIIEVTTALGGNIYSYFCL